MAYGTFRVVTLQQWQLKFSNCFVISTKERKQQKYMKPETISAVSLQQELCQTPQTSVCVFVCCVSFLVNIFLVKKDKKRPKAVLLSFANE